MFPRQTKRTETGWEGEGGCGLAMTRSADVGKGKGIDQVIVE